METETLKKTQTIMYCPLNDGHIIKEIQNFAQKIFEEKVDGFKQKYGTIKLEGETPFHEMICNLPAMDIVNSDILLFDKVVADYDHKHLLDQFWGKNKMELDKPSVHKSTEREIFFVVAALMNLKATWDIKHRAEKNDYRILASDSKTQKELRIKGYSLKNVAIALKDNSEVSVSIDLGNDITLQLSDLTAFGSKNLEISDEHHLYELVTSTDMRYFETGLLFAPCIEEKCRVENHLGGICWSSDDLLYQAYIQSSEALTKLKLNEKGVEARAETVAHTRLVLGCSVGNMSRTYRLVITHGLVVDISYKNQSIFVAYVPQEKFIKA